MLTMKFHGVEISIAGGGEEIVRAQISCPFFLFFFFFFFFIQVLCFITGTKTTWSASYGKEKPLRPPLTSPRKKESPQVPLVWDQPHISPGRNPTISRTKLKESNVTKPESRKQKENRNPITQINKRNPIQVQRENH